MNTLPLDCLVANYLACECMHGSLEHEDGVYSIPLDEAHWLGVTLSPSESSLIFFAHPGGADPHDSPQSGEISSEEAGEELELGDDIDGTWTLSTDRASGRHTLWIDVEHELVGHAEFARIVDQLRCRFDVWNKVLARGNEA